MIIVKLGGILVLIVLFFWLFIFGPLYDHLVVQLAVLSGAAGWHIKRFSFRETISVLKFCLPFVLSLFVFGLVFHFMRLFGRGDWLQDSLIKCLVFPSSLVFIKIMLTYITYLAVLSNSFCLPYAMRFQK